MNQVVRKIKFSDFGRKEGKQVYVFKLTNASGNYVELINYGATLKSIVVPDKYGNKANVVLGYPTLEGYASDKCYIGSTVGPFANRIAKASFTIGNKTYMLDKNDGENNNHSGSAGFNTKVFDFEIDEDVLTFTSESPDGEGGFPGNLKVKVIYSWSDANELKIEYSAITNIPTPVNFTNHAYFNLTGGRETIHNHRLNIASSQTLECTPDYIPTGIISSEEELLFRGQLLEDVMKSVGLNNYYILQNELQTSDPASILYEDISGRIMKVYTSYPGVQLYTGDYLNSELNGSNGRPQQPFDGLCLECQYYPDSPNHPHFPSTLLQPTRIYNETITYAFGTQP